MILVPVKKILCPIDFSGPSYEALDYAVGLSSSLGAELCLVHVLPKIADPEWARPLHSNPDEVSLVLSEYEWALYTSAQRKLHEVMQQRMPDVTKPRAIVKVGEAAAEIMRVADEENSNLIIIASRGLTGRPDMFGSVTERVARLAACPLLIVPAGRIRQLEYTEWRKLMIDPSIRGALSEEVIDRILADSFPASDPPPWTLGREDQRPSGFVDSSSKTV